MAPHARMALAAFSVATFLGASTARAQLTTTMATGPSVTQGAQTAPERFVNGNDLGTATRPAGLNPTGINYSDCISDMTLRFPVILNGFGTGNTDGMQVWASVAGTCTTDAARGVGQPPLCWLVSEGLPLGQVFTGSTTYDIRVQDIVGPQQAPPDPPVLVHEGTSACSAQLSYAAVTITLWFVPLSTEETYDMSATALEWPLNTDLVGPPAPNGVTVGAGEMLLIANWAANADSDTLGYDVFIDPPPGSLAQTSPVTQTICPGSSSSIGVSTSSASSSTASIVDGAASSVDATEDTTASTSDDGAGADDAGDATLASGSSSSANSASSSAGDAGCFTVNVAQGGSAIGVCSSAVLGSAIVVDSGVAPIEDDSGEDGAVESEMVDGGITGIGGVATIPCQYAIGVGCPSGSPVYTAQSTTVTGETNTSFTIKNLTDGVTYAVAVAAVDNSGNPGPPSAPTACNYPAPVNDFYALYRDAGGQAGGGFCALQGGTKLDASSDSPVSSSIVFGMAGTLALAAARRRSRTKK